MSGICGVVSATLSWAERNAIIRRMLNAMKHRGPDGQGIYQDGPCTLGHARLAIVGSTAMDDQPMTDDGTALVLDGELHTLREEQEALRQDGIAFQGTSDTEVLLKLYRRHGLSFLKRIKGMYAFALWDSERGMLVCARDLFGIKPFLYAQTAQGLVFASEMRALLASGLVNPSVDRQALRCLLERGSVYQPMSILKDVSWLMPGHSLTVKGCGTAASRLFATLHADSIVPSKVSEHDLASELKARLDIALDRQVISGTPMGVFLSGGLDSSLLTALMVQRGVNLRTFSIGFEEGLDTTSVDETDDAQVVARHLGVEHKKTILYQNDVIDNLPMIASGLDHPTLDGVNSWFVARAAGQDIKVAISGTGADELFAGYPWFRAMKDWNEEHSCEQRPANDGFFSEFLRQYHVFSPAAATALCPDTQPPGSPGDSLPSADVIARVTGMLLKGYLQNQLLADMDTAAMWHSLEVRVPFLDEDVAAFALRLPPELKLAGGALNAPPGSYAATGVKHILLKMAEPLLPTGFSYQGKRGFTLPFDGWLRSGLAPVMNDLLSDETTKKRGYFNPGVVSNVRNDFRDRRISWFLPWMLMMTELWSREVLDKRPALLDA